MSSRSAAKLSEFSRFAAELQTEDGSSLEVHPFQKTMLRAYFDGARETALIIPKKNGKSTLMAALALYHLVVTPNAECVMVAASRDQAEIVLRQARMFIRKAPALERIVSVRQRSIISELDEGRIRVLAADADTADGIIPTLAIVDELHRHRTAELYGVCRDGLGPRNGQLITISTAGATMDSPLGELRRRAYELPGFKRRSKHNEAHSPDGAFAFHEWCLDPEDDVSDMALVKKANPAPWQSVKALTERFGSPTMTPWQWRRFACGIWTEGEEPWIEPEMWDRLADRELAPIRGERLFVDVRTQFQRAAIAMVAPRGDTTAVFARILPAPTSFETVEQIVRDLAANYDVTKVLHGGRGFARSAEILEAEGLPMLEFPASPERMSQASGTLYRLLETKALRHDGSPDLRAQVLAGTVRKDERGWRLQEDPMTHHPIEALISLAVATHVCGELVTTLRSAYADHDVIFV